MTMEERLSLLEQNAAAQVPTPTEYYTSRWSGEEIDKGISGALQLGGATTTQAALRNIGGRPSRNLLDNWYFVGGGSQQGGGQFPVNQRGQTSYQNYGNIIDRWICNYGATVTINSSGVVISRTPDGPAEIFMQRLPLSLLSQLAGQVVTLSAIINGQLGSSTFTMPEDLSTLIDSSEVIIDGLLFDIFDIPSSGNCRARFFSDSTSQFTLTAAKLELGPTQTLAYQDEDGNWQLFETPDYGEELAKCQRYLLVLPGFDTLYSGIGVGSFFSETEAEITIPTPTSMRIIPTCTATGIWMLRGGGQIINVDANTSNFLVQQMSSNSVSMIIGELSGCPLNQAAQLLRGNNNTAKIIFSAEL